MHLVLKNVLWINTCTGRPKSRRPQAILQTVTLFYIHCGPAGKYIIWIYDICWRYIFLGPLVYKNTDNIHSLIGVVSFGPETCVHNGLPNVYARVTEVLGWIFKMVKSSKLCLPAKTELFSRINLQNHH
jgi:hypothetical protein